MLAVTFLTTCSPTCSSRMTAASPSSPPRRTSCAQGLTTECRWSWTRRDGRRGSGEASKPTPARGASRALTGRGNDVLAGEHAGRQRAEQWPEPDRPDCCVGACTHSGQGRASRVSVIDPSRSLSLRAGNGSSCPIPAVRNTRRLGSVGGKLSVVSPQLIGRGCHDRTRWRTIFDYTKIKPGWVSPNSLDHLIDAA